MREAAPVSAVLITRDAAEYFDRVLSALRCCSEIVVLDSGSSDRTREIALEHGASWFERDFDGYGSQKRHAVVRARFDWILSVDADEVLDDEAGAALAAWDAGDAGAAGAAAIADFKARVDAAIDAARKENSNE